MTASISPIRADRKWYGLALRHLRMALRLLRSGFSDGAVFHAYHAYECVLSAFIAANGYPVPPDGWVKLQRPTGKTVKVFPSPNGLIQENSAHKARIIFFGELADRTKPYYASHSQLSRIITSQDRQDSLYYDASTDRSPFERYQGRFAQDLLQTVRHFAQDIRREIP